MVLGLDMRVNMKQLFAFLITFFVMTSFLIADFPWMTYSIGFRTVTVQDYKKHLKETGEEIPIFPPRTGNAVLAGGVQKGSRADIAGLENNDLIRIINGKLLRTPDEADGILKSVTYKDKLELGVIRRGRDQWERLAITIEALSEEEHIERSIVGSNPVKYKDHWYSTRRHRESPENYGSGDINLNIAVVDDKPEFLYLCIGRLDSEDLFTRKYTVKTDENTYELIDLPPNEVKDINSRIDALLIAEQAKVKDIIDHIKAGKPLLEDQVRLLEKAWIGSARTEEYRKSQGGLTKLVGFKNGERSDTKRYENERYWETYDKEVSKSQEKMILDIATSKTVTIRYSGTKYYHELEIPSEVRSRMELVMKSFKNSGGKLFD